MLFKSLRSKILALFIGLIVAIQMATIVSVIISTDKSVEANAVKELAVGHRVFDKLMENRSQQLFDNAVVLTSDFGFKQAVATQDKNTILSVLTNQGERISANLMLLTDLQGSHIAATVSSEEIMPEGVYKDLLKDAEVDGGLVTTILYNQQPYQVAVVPVEAPQTIAWAMVGTRIDAQLAEKLKQITNLEVSFVSQVDGKESYMVSTKAGDSILNQGIGELVRFQVRELPKQLVKKSVLSKRGNASVFALLETPLSKSYARFDQLKLQMIVITLIGLFLSIFVALVLSNTVTKPIRALIGGATRISRGQYNQTIEVPKNDKELKILAKALNTMQQGISDREKQILYQAHYDALTSLPNRVYMRQILEKLLPAMIDAGKTTALLDINVNDFKQINDTFGHKVGDGFLQAVAKRLLTHSVSKEYVARLGADEFLLIYTNVHEAELPKSVLNLMRSLEEPFEVDDISLQMEFSVGVVVAPLHGSQTDQLLRRCDIAMHVAKDDKLGYIFYESGQDEKHLKQISLINDLKKAIEEDQLVMYFQPKWDIQDDIVKQAEALVRWVHPKMGFIPPDEFIYLAEQSGMMPSLTRWVMTTVARQWAKWHSEGLEMEFAVNLSAHDLSQEQFPDFVAELIDLYHMPPEALVLEITESAVMKDPKQAINTLCRLKELGIILAIDDFGTGYSSLSQLKSMPVDELKIDKSFVLQLARNLDDQTIVRATVELAHNLGMKVVAEGVENQESWHLLESYGCEMLQGFYISKPIPPHEFEIWYRENIANDFVSLSRPKNNPTHSSNAFKH